MKQNRKRALFVVGGFGLGNSTRCGAIISELIAQGLRVDIATSSNGLWYFSKMAHLEMPVEIGVLGFSTKENRIALFKSALKLPYLLVVLLRNSLILWRLIRKNDYAFAIVDSEYSIFPLKVVLRFPVFTLNNVFSTLLDSAPPELSKNLRMQRLVEHLDRLLQIHCSDFQIAPILNPELEGLRGTTFFCPPPVRESLSALPAPVSFERALLIASGSGLGVSKGTVDTLLAIPWVTELTVLGLEGESAKGATYVGRRQEVSEYFERADFVVCNGGFSSLSEGLMTNRPLLVLPIEGHYEQILNGALIEKMGRGIVSSEIRLAEDLERLKKFKMSPILRSSGTKPAVDFVLSRLEEK